MRNKWLILLLCVAAAVCASAQVQPTKVAAFVSTTGTLAGPWEPLTGSGGTAVPNLVPLYVAIFYSTDGTGNPGTWAPCTTSCFGGGGGSGTVTVVGSGNLTSTALVTGGGLQALQTPSATSTLDSSGNLSVAAGGSLGSADIGTPKFTFATNKITVNQPLYHAQTSNQEVFGTSTNLTTSTYPASSGAVTLTFPNTSEYMVGANSDTTTTHVLHATAVPGVFNSAAIATGDLPTIPIAGGGTNATSAASAGMVPNTSSTTASAWTITPTLGVAGTSNGTLTFASSTATGSITLSPAAATSAVTVTIPFASGDTLIAESASDTTTTHVLHATATGAIGTFSAIAAGDLPTTLTSGTIVPAAGITPQSIDCHTACSPTAAQLSNAQVWNYGQAAANVQVTGPTVAAGMNFLMVVGTAQAANYWRYTSTTANIYLDGGASAVTNIIFAAPAVGNSFSCFSFQIGASTYALKCTTLAGTSTSS